MTFEQKLYYKNTMTNWYKNIKIEGITSNRGDGICVGLGSNFMNADSWTG